jgi:hypothetical protein
VTRDAEIVMLAEHLATCRKLCERYAFVCDLVAPMMPMTIERLDSVPTADAVSILAFLKTFEQFEDALHRTLKTVAMIMQFGKAERLTPRDVANRAVALGILDEGKSWADAVRVRNALAHEYPLDPGKQAGQVNAAWDAGATLVATLESIIEFVRRERLEHGDL